MEAPFSISVYVAYSDKSTDLSPTSFGLLATPKLIKRSKRLLSKLISTFGTGASGRFISILPRTVSATSLFRACPLVKKQQAIKKAIPIKRAVRVDLFMGFLLLAVSVDVLDLKCSGGTCEGYPDPGEVLMKY